MKAKIERIIYPHLWNSEMNTLLRSYGYLLILLFQIREKSGD
jgi:hypothetical protein